MNRELFQNTNFLAALFDSIPAMLFVVDDDVRIKHLNAAAKKFNGYDSLHQLLDSGGQALNCINVADDTNGCGKHDHCRKCLIRRSVGAASRGRSVFRDTTRMELVDKSGHRNVHFLVTASPFTHENQPLILLILEDITDLKQSVERLKLLNELLEYQVATDHLTGICNRLRFNEHLSRNIDDARRYGHPLALMMFDIDHFKQVNDLYGHAVGDCVLREVTGLVTALIRKNDVFARWGGEEFMILSSHTDREHMRVIAEKLRQAIDSHGFSGPQHITSSFGVTQLDGWIRSRGLPAGWMMRCIRQKAAEGTGSLRCDRRRRVL